jgi:glycosyltransferase involved in cell wall biosynthesis
MKILMAPAHVALNNRGSEASYVFNLLLNLTKIFNVQIDVICGKNYERMLPPNIRVFEVGFDKGDLINRGLFYFKCLSISKKLYKNADLIHHMFPFGFKAGFNLLTVFGYLRNKPFIIGPIQYPQEYSDAYDFMLISGKKGAKAKIMYGLENAIEKSTLQQINILHEVTLGEAETLVFDSNKTLMLYRNLYSDLLRGKMLEVIPPGVETEIFKYISPVKKDEFEIMTAGYLLKRKGIQYLIGAMPLILREIKNVKLRIVGDGPFKHELMRLVKRLSLDDTISFEGFVPRNELVNYYAKCDIYVQPSLSETFPSTIREAMSIGRPVVATNVGFIEEHVIDGVNGFLVPRGNSGAIADKVAALLSDEDLRLKMGTRARTYAKNNFDWDKIVTMWYDVYKKSVMYTKPSEK